MTIIIGNRYMSREAGV